MNLSSKSQIPGYPNRSLPLVPKVLAGVSRIRSRIQIHQMGQLEAGSYVFYSDLDINAWDVLGDESCHNLAVIVKLILAEDIVSWSNSEFCQVPVGLSISALSNLQLSPRVKNGLQRTLHRLDIKNLDQPTIEQIVKIKQFGPSAVLELFGRLESDFGPGVPIRDFFPVPLLENEKANAKIESNPAALTRTTSSISGVKPCDGILIPEEIWIRSIDSLGLSIRTARCLKRSQVGCLGDLASKSESDFFRIRNFGVKSLAEVETALVKYGLTVRRDGGPRPRIDSVDREIDNVTPTQYPSVRSERYDRPKPIIISLRTLIEIPEIGVSGALELLGVLEQTGLKGVDPSARYPSRPLPLLPRAISESSLLLSRLNDVLVEPYDNTWESYDSEARDVIAAKIIDGLEHLRHDPKFVRELFDTTIRAPFTSFERFSLTEESRSMIISGRVIRSVGGDPIEVWDYIDSRVGERQGTVLKKRWRDGMTLVSIGQSIGITRERVRQIEVKCIKKLRHGLSGLKAKGLTERLRWVETHLLEAVEDHGGFAEISSVENVLGWPDQSVNTWIAFNAIFGVLSSKHSPKDFGRLLVDGSNLSSLAHLFNDPEAGSLKKLAKDIIGPMGIMRLEDFLATLDRQSIEQGYGNSDPLMRGRALDTAGVLNLLDTSYSDELRSGRWVVVGLTFAVREIARAIIYGSDPYDESDVVELLDANHLREGLRSDLIAYWLNGNSDYKSGARAIDVLCARYPQVFTKTGATSWGLVGVGADISGHDDHEPSTIGLIVHSVAELRQTKSTISKSDVATWLSKYRSYAWINIQIDRALKDGYLVNEIKSADHYALNIGKELPFHEKVDGKLAPAPPKRKHGLTSELVLEALEGKPRGLTENDIVLFVRQHDPSASAVSIAIYIRYTYAELIEVTANGNFRLRRNPLSSGRKIGDSLSTIETLTQVLTDALEPLPIDEIIARCEQIKPVKYRAIRGYLSQNYGERFSNDGQGRYSIA